VPLRLAGVHRPLEVLRQLDRLAVAPLAPDPEATAHEEKFSELLFAQ
jgi:hypothetical protein